MIFRCAIALVVVVGRLAAVVVARFVGLLGRVALGIGCELPVSLHAWVCTARGMRAVHSLSG